MAKNIYGGGNLTNLNGLKFEQETDMQEALLAIDGYTIQNNTLYFNNEYIGILASKNNLYKILLEPKGIYYQNYISKKLLPDEALYIDKTNTVFIIEKKFQNVAGSVDKKLQTCGFKKTQYSKLFSPIGINVVYLYILNDWFTQRQYKDVLEFITESSCFTFLMKYHSLFLDYHIYIKLYYIVVHKNNILVLFLCTFC